MKLLSQCAEAKIYKDKNTILKDRVPKSYRLKILDNKIRNQRTRSELKILEKASSIIPVPKLLNNNSKTEIKMEFIDGKKLSEHLDKFLEKTRIEICSLIGKQLAELHNNNIIHGDLTTSNMILRKKELYFIDFGLSYIDDKIEHKAVDIHLLKQALESKHYKHFLQSFETVLNSYKQHAKDADKILERFNAVELRGRYKHK